MNFTRTRKPTRVETAVALTRDELSAKIQWLIDFAGTDTVMNNVANDFCAKCKVERITVNGELDPSAGYKNKIIFNTRTGDVGHWILFSETGEEFNSYKLGHQKPATNQFCQSFATLYMLHNCGKSNVPDFFGQLHQASSKMRLADRYNTWGHNVNVIISMWKWIFEQWTAKSTRNKWFIGEFKAINNEYIHINASTRIKSKKMTLIGDTINMDLIVIKLDDILAHKTEIAEKT